MKQQLSTSDGSQPSIAWEKAAVIGLFAIGILLRLRQYLSGRSLWADEAMLALNIVNRDFGGLFKPLEYDQGAPIGFLLVEKFFNLILGRNELVLRFFPFLAGLASLWLFYLLLKQTTRGAGLLAALALITVDPQMVYYSSESKQYMVDVAVTLGVFLVAAATFQERARKQDLVVLGLAGSIALWFSHPSLFVLGGIGVTLMLLLLKRRDYSGMWLTTGMGLFWLANLGLLYFVNLRDLSLNQYLMDYWKDAYIPLPPWSNLDWFVTSFVDNVSFQFGIDYLAWLLFILMLAGWLALFREQRTYATAFAFSTLFAFVASALRLYPVSGRLGLFLAPIGIVLLGKAVEALHKRLSFNRLWAAAATIILSGCLIYGPFVTSLQSLIAPKYFEHIRPTMDYLSDSWKAGDKLFVSYWAEPAFRFYAPFYGLDEVSYISSELADYPDQQKLKSRVEPLIGKERVWVLLTHVHEQRDFNERDFMVEYLDGVGRKRREFRRSGTSVYLFLYNLRK
jgi:hypothetical protein